MDGDERLSERAGTQRDRGVNPSGQATSSVLVAGAGLVGAAAALYLAERGYQVTVIDRSPPQAGISAFDRAKTIKVAISQNVKKKDIVSPGHVFPLVARKGGVLERAGHTEGSIDISILSKLNPSSVICEVMNEDGRMARLDDLKKFSKKHKIKIASIADIISYRLKNENLIYKSNTRNISYKNLSKFQLSVYKNRLNNFESFVLSKGKIKSNTSIPVRVLSKKIKRSAILNNKEIRGD